LKELDDVEELSNPLFYYLIDCHLSRDKIHPAMQKQYQVLLETAPKVINVMIQIANERIKKGKMNFDTFNSLINFKQMFL